MTSSRRGSSACRSTPRLTGSTGSRFEPRRPRIGVVASGIGHQAVLRALADLGLDRERLGGARAAAGADLDAVAAGEAEQLRAVRRRARDGARGRGQAAVRRGAAQGGALPRAATRRWVLGKQDREGRELLPVGGAVSADDVARALARVLPRDGVPAELRERMRVGRRGSRAPARSPRARAQAHSVLLLGLPAQHLDARRRRAADRRRHRLPHDGRARARRPPRARARDAADGRRGRAVDRPRAVRRRAALHAEPRRRHLPPLRLAGDPGRDRRRA